MSIKKRTKKYFAPQKEDSARKCDHPDCDKKGEFRAPKDRSLKEYHWFCLKHVQEYNAKWDYFDGISTDSPEDEKPKPKMRFSNFKTKVKYNFGYSFDENHNIYEEYDPSFLRKESFYFSSLEKKYLKMMELNTENFSEDSLKRQYKILVKKYHPDLNPNNPQAEENFKLLGMAYKELLKKLI